MAHAQAFSEANKQYAASYPAEAAALGAPPVRKLAIGSSPRWAFNLYILNCYSSNLHGLALGVRKSSPQSLPLTEVVSRSNFASLGIKLGDAHVIRNAGGVGFVSRQPVLRTRC